MGWFYSFFEDEVAARIAQLKQLCLDLISRKFSKYELCTLTNWLYEILILLACNNTGIRSSHEYLKHLIGVKLDVSLTDLMWLDTLVNIRNKIAHCDSVNFHNVLLFYNTLNLLDMSKQLQCIFEDDSLTKAIIVIVKLVRAMDMDEFKITGFIHGKLTDITSTHHFTK